MKKIRLIIFVLFLGLPGACSKMDSAVNLYVPTASDTTASATLSELQQGRTLYINNCQSCHSLYSPDDFSSGSWKSIVASMAPRTGLNASQIDLVTKYVSRGR